MKKKLAFFLIIATSIVIVLDIIRYLLLFKDINLFVEKDINSLITLKGNFNFNQIKDFIERIPYEKSTTVYEVKPIE